MEALRYLTLALSLVCFCDVQAQVQVDEPGIIVVQPSPPIDTQGGKLSLSCVAYGEPELPTVVWSARSLGVTDFQEPFANSDVNVTISTSVINDTETGLVFVLSILQLCGVNYTYSFVDDFRCEAVTNRVGRESDIGYSGSFPFSMRPFIYEPALIVVAPNNNSMFLNDVSSTVSITCAAYGSPQPMIRWMQNGFNISDSSNTTNVRVTTVEDSDGDNIFVLSSLEYCGGLGREMISCVAENGVPLEISDNRTQSVNFITNPAVELVRWTLRFLGDTLEFSFFFTAPVTIAEDSLCFLDNLRFTVSINSAVFFRLRHPGLCLTVQDSLSVVAYLDPQELRNVLTFFSGRTALFVYTSPGTESDFFPPTSLLPIARESALLVGQLIQNSDMPRMLSFDIDLSNNSILMHFDHIMDTSTLDITHFTLINTRNGNSMALTNTITYYEIAKTVCAAFVERDQMTLASMSICNRSPLTCACSFSSDLIMSYSRLPVQNVTSLLPLPVSKLRLRSNLNGLAVYMQLSLSYDGGCNAINRLAPDEVYVLRDGETVTSIECFTSGAMGYVNPIISFDAYEGPLTLDNPPTITPGRIVQDGVRHVSLNLSSSGGLLPQYFGLYSCRSGDLRIEHYIYNMTPYLALPNGDLYTVNFYDSLLIPFVLGSDPLISLMSSRILIFDIETNRPVSIQPDYTRLTPYKGVMLYERALPSHNGSFIIRIIIGRDVLARIDFTIIVNPPNISVVPPVTSILPTDTEVTLQCLNVGGNPSVPIIWISPLSSIQALGTEPTLTLDLSVGGDLMDGMVIYCAVRDPESNDPNPEGILAYSGTVIRHIQEPLVVLYNGVAVENDGNIQLDSKLPGDLHLQCIGHYPSGFTSLQWISEEDGRDTMNLYEANSTGYISVSYSYNVANITINNRIRLYQGTLICRYDETNQITITISDQTNMESCDQGVMDDIYGIVWSATPVGSSNTQPCPNLNGRETQGLASRWCLPGQVWGSMVDVSRCENVRIANLRESGDAIFSDDDLSMNELSSSLDSLTGELNSSTIPGNESLLPRDLGNVNYLLENIVEKLPVQILQTGLIDTFNNVLAPVNKDGWLNVSSGSNLLLENIENFGDYLIRAQTFDAMELKRENIVVNTQKIIGSSFSDIIFPRDLNTSTQAQLKVPAALLQQDQPTGVVNSLIKNLADFFPMENLEAGTRVPGGVILSTQLIGGRDAAFGDEAIELNYNTTRLMRASKPECVFRNTTINMWDKSGVNTVEVKIGETGEYTTFRVKCESSHATAFTVLVDIEAEEFELTGPVYAGYILILLGAVVSMVAVVLACILDKLREYAFVPFFTHLNFCVALISICVIFLAGVKPAVADRSACLATAALLHFFFTAAYVWIMCEAIILVFYPWFSKNWFSFILIFLLGWLLPALPTLITVGILREDYVTSSSHCWFFFDGTFGTEIVLAFILPKIIIFTATLLLLVVGVIGIWWRSRLLPKGISTTYIHLLGFTSVGVFFLLSLLSLSWIFALLLVNAYGVDPGVSDWIFMAASIALAICVLVFNIGAIALNKRVDYVYLWSDVKGDVVKDPMTNRNEGGYEMDPFDDRDTNKLINVDPTLEDHK